MMKKTYAILLLLVAACLNSLPALASSSDFSTVEFEEDHSLPIVYLSIIADVGVANDPKDKLGLAKVAGQMMLRGTQKHSKAEFFELLNRLGGTIEVETRNEGTIFRAAVLSENLDKFLDLLDEALSKPKFTAEELKSVKKEVEGEILERKGNDKALVQYNFYRFFYGDHPFGNPDLGTQRGVKNVNYKDIVNYYTQYFGGHSLRVFGAGAASKDSVEKWFGALLEKLAAIHPDSKPAEPVARPDFGKGRRMLLVDKPRTTQTQVLMGGPGMRPEMPNYYAILLANQSFGAPSFQARMMREIRVKRGWTYGAYNTFRFGPQPKHFAMYVFPKTEDTPQTISLAINLFEDFAKNGITQEEFKFARDSLLNNAPFNYDTSKKRLENLTAEYMMHFPRGYYRDFAKNIAKVSYEDITAALKTFFDPSNLALTVVGDAGKLKTKLSTLPGFAKPAVKNYLED